MRCCTGHRRPPSPSPTVARSRDLTTSRSTGICAVIKRAQPDHVIRVIRAAHIAHATTDRAHGPRHEQGGKCAFGKIPYVMFGVSIVSVGVHVRACAASALVSGNGGLSIHKRHARMLLSVSLNQRAPRFDIFDALDRRIATVRGDARSATLRQSAGRGEKPARDALYLSNVRQAPRRVVAVTFRNPLRVAYDLPSEESSGPRRISGARSAR